MYNCKKNEIKQIDFCPFQIVLIPKGQSDVINEQIGRNVLI